jgi:N-methylhydantoinase A
LSEHRPPQPYTIGIDIGGTFTDLVVLSERGDLALSKVATTPNDFSNGVIDAIHEVARSMGLSVSELVGRTRFVKHGSTVATNALITRAGASVGFITTHGFEDTTLMMRAVGRVDGLPEEEVRHVTWVTKPEPLVPPERIRGVRERISAAGEVIVPLNQEDARQAIAELIQDHQVQALAISLLHAWINPEHERAMRGLIQELYPETAVYCSFGSELSGVAGEYARGNTAIANAYVGPIVQRYLANLEEKLRWLGFRGTFMVMQGNGGLAGWQKAAPIAQLQSGPAGGMLASSYMAAMLSHSNGITADMGGTSFDVGLLTEGYWRYAEEPIFERFRILQPIIDIQSIGAGGGTIARVDEATGRLLVGPQSAGANPGPACYGAGGEQPTVTDADLLLGYIDPDYFLGGRRKLHRDRAYRVFEEKLARPLGLDVAQAAAGVYDIINSKMSDLIRREVVRSGHLPEEYVLYAFGGASPVHAVAYARDLGIGEISVFPTSSVFSAFGIAMADVVQTRVASRYYTLPVEAGVLNGDLDELEAELKREIERQELELEDISFWRSVSMRFRRQTAGEELVLPWDRFSQARVDELVRLFVRRYEELYGEGSAYQGAGVDISAIRVDAVSAVAKPTLRRAEPAGREGEAEVKGLREAYFDGRFMQTLVYEYERLLPGQRVRGPAIVESPVTTTILPPGSSAEVDQYLRLAIRS